MTTLAMLIQRASEHWYPAVEAATLGTVDAGEIAGLIERFVADQLATVERALFYKPGVGVVAGLRLIDGRDVVVKVHRWNVTVDRLSAVQRVQAHLASVGQPAPLPLVTPVPLGNGIATVEQFLAGGRPADGHEGDVRRAVAAGLHAFTEATADLVDLVDVGDPLIMRPPGASLWPEPHDLRFDFRATAGGAEWIDQLALLARQRLAGVVEKRIVGHLDWRIENLGVIGGRIIAIYDWDSVAAAPEPVVVGNNAAQFPVDWTRNDVDPLPTLGEMRMFVEDYEHARGTKFSARERELLDAANLALCAYGARCQHSDMTLHADIGGSATTRWLRLLRERGEKGLAR